MDLPAEEKSVREILQEILEQGNETLLRNVLTDLHPADIAEAIIAFDRDIRNTLFAYLDHERAAQTLCELDKPYHREILDSLSEERLARIIGTMNSDDATDIISELDKDIAGRILVSMPKKGYRDVAALMRHEEDTAGGIMALEIVAVGQDRTAAEALEVLRNKADEVEDVYNIYVIDKNGVLVGLASLKDVVTASPKAPLSQIMETDPVAVLADMDQEEVANLFGKYDLVAAPVVDDRGRLVGRITVDDVLDVVKEEASEDITRMAGITDDEIGERSIFKTSYVRLPWLLVAFVGEILSAKVLEHFIPSDNELIIATFFIPLIMAMGGNIGIQSSTVIIRGLAIGDIRLRDTGWRLIQEISAAFLNGLLIAVLLLGVVSWMFHDVKFGGILSSALLSVLMIAAFVGTLIPLFLKRIHVDPAIATGPFITTSNDMLGLLIYFSIIRAAGF
ncbi:magnesium transporter [bacterium]|nr:magnesium transporter [bacterium]